MEEESVSEMDDFLSEPTPEANMLVGDTALRCPLSAQRDR